MQYWLIHHHLGLYGFQNQKHAFVLTLLASLLQTYTWLTVVHHQSINQGRLHHKWKKESKDTILNITNNHSSVFLPTVAVNRKLKVIKKFTQKLTKINLAQEIATRYQQHAVEIERNAAATFHLILDLMMYFDL